MSATLRMPRMVLGAVGAVAALGLSGCITISPPVPAPAATQPAATQPPVQAASNATTEPSAPPQEQSTSGAASVNLENELGTVFVTVPTSWTDVEYGSWSDPNGLTFDTILAAPDLDQYRESWDASGVEVRGRSQVVSTSLREMIDAEIEPYVDQCTPSRVHANYSDDYYTGLISVLADCAGIGTEYVVFAGYPRGDQSATIMVVLQLGGNEPDRSSVAETIFNSFDTSGN